jgi:endonuclease/exonuclease/phosphatase family metal-dependent hydrolase
MVEAKTLKIATYNVENLFDMQRSGYEYKEYIPRQHNWTEPILTKKLTHIAEVICDLDADVIGLQEVESDRVLKRLQQVLKRVGCDYPYRAITASKQTPIHNALLSKIAIKKKRDLTIYRTGRQRSILEVVLKTDPKLRLFVNHWKSKAGPESERLPYAKALAKRLSSLPKGSEYLLLGDFNSNYDEYRSIDAKHNDTGGKTGINHLLKTTREGKMVRWHDLGEGYHYSLWMELPTHARWSHNFYGDKEGIDAIIVPSTLHDGSGWEYQPGSFGVFRPDYLFGKRGRVKRWEYRHSKHTGKGYSDHLPIYAVLETGGEGSVPKREEKGFWEGLWSLFGSSETVEEPHAVIQPVVSKTETVSLSIAELIAKEKLTAPIRLNAVNVIFKQKDTVIIKQHPEGRAILLYRCAGAMQEGHAYDITAFLKKQYKGLDELVDIAVEQERGAVEIAPYLQTFAPEMMQEKRFVNEVVRGIEGRYQKREIIVAGTAVPLYFKKGVKRPKEGSRIRIKRAQIGYYKNHNELVVWDQNDYRILE